MDDVTERLRNCGNQPASRRIAGVEFVLSTAAPATADEVWMHLRSFRPTTSRATVYDTHNLFAGKGRLRPQLLGEGVVVFDPRVKPHRHFIEEDTGKVIDVLRGALTVRGEKPLKRSEVRSYRVVMRSRRRKSQPFSLA